MNCTAVELVDGGQSCEPHLKVVCLSGAGFSPAPTHTTGHAGLHPAIHPVGYIIV